MKSICILTQSHLCRNPRVVKEANALAAARFEVTILTTFTRADLLEEDLNLIDTSQIKLKGIINMIPGQASSLYRLKQRLFRKFAGDAVGILGWENIFTLGYSYGANLKAAIRENADLYTCHQEMSTVIGCKLIKRGFKVAFDFEDWYSHDLLPEANKNRPIKLLERYEKFALLNSVLNYTTSKSMASGLAAFAGVEPPKVLHNVFPLAERDLLDGKHKDRSDFSRPSMHWYSQTIGPGRGLEFLVRALEQVTMPVQLHMRGNCSEEFKNEITSIFPFEKGHMLFFHRLVPHTELLSRISEHDIGLAMEENRPDSRNLTITNKILQYLLAGIAVIASDTAGQKEVAAMAPNAVFLFRNYDLDDLARKINSLIAENATLKNAKKAALSIANNKFCWEHEERLLINWINEVI
jgi:hypothetical protein